MTVTTRTLAGGSSVGAFRVSGQGLRPYPSTAADRVAGHMVTHLENSSESIRQFLLTCQYMELVPARLSRNVALRSCVALFASAWANFQRGLPCSEVTDRKLYGNALRTLRSALSGNGPFNSETLAAVSVMERFEIMFDPGRPLFWSSHRDGIIGLMTRQGPPELDDEMSIWLAIDNYNILASHWLVKGGHNFYDDKWHHVIEKALETYPGIPDMKKDAYRVEMYLGIWAPIVHEMKRIVQAPGHETRDAQLQLHHRATSLATELDRLGMPMMERGRAQGLIIEVPDPETPVGAKYDFGHMDGQRCLSNYAMLRVVLNRVIWSLTILLQGQAPVSLDEEHQRFCRMIWMCLPYTRATSLMAAILFGDPLFLSYEGAQGETREYILSWLMEIAQFRKRMPNNRKVVHEHLLSVALAFTGRGEFDERPDFPYWELRSNVVGD